MKFGRVIILVLVFSFARQTPTDSLLISPTTRGTFELLQTGATLFFGYGTVNQNVRMILENTRDGLRLDFQPQLSSTVTPFLVIFEGVTYIADTPGLLTPVPDGDYLIYFDTVQVFAQHSQQEDILFSLGMIENFSPLLPVERSRPDFTVEAVIESQGRHTLVMRDAAGEQNLFNTASQLPRYSPQYVGQALAHPASFQFLGWAEGADLPDMVRAMFPAVPRDADVPAPGVQESPIPLWLPFDCADDWVISWGFHLSTHQNRYAVDFASLGGGGMARGLPVRAAHDGTVSVKIFGYDGHYVDLGIAARVSHADGITATEYGHLDESTLGFWNVESANPFEWIEVGEVSAGEVVGFTGSTGYATGPHIHFALWTFDQSIYRPVFDTLREFERGFAIPASARIDCGRYRP